MFPTLLDPEFPEKMAQLMESTTEKSDNQLYEEGSQLTKRLDELISHLMKATHNAASTWSMIKHLKLRETQTRSHRSECAFCDESQKLLIQAYQLSLKKKLEMIRQILVELRGVGHKVCQTLCT